MTEQPAEASTPWGVDDNIDKFTSMAVNLLHTFVTQMVALKKYRSKGEQKGKGKAPWGRTRRGREQAENLPKTGA